ncbi:MAG: MFS transporter [Pseudomonadota bacterium]
MSETESSHPGTSFGASAEPSPVGSGLALPWPTPRAAWTILTVVSLAYVLSYIDRIVINLLVEPIQDAFSINDTQFGALQSLAFGIFYVALGIPIARIADRSNRRRVIGIGVFVFGLFTVLSGLARTYAQLFLARVGVGSGEAAVSPAAYSLIADSFPPEKLGRAISVFTMTAFMGIGLAYLAGGLVIGTLESVGNVTLPLLGELEPWRMTFIIVGIPAILFAPLMLAVKGAPRRDTRPPASMGQVVGHLRKRGRAFAFIFFGFSVIAFSSYASTVWNPALLIRVFGLSPVEVALALGIIYLTIGPMGALLGGHLCDRYTSRGHVSAPLTIAAIGYIPACLFGIAAPLAPTTEIALVCLALAAFFGMLPYPLAATAIQLITPGRMRGQVSAVYLTIVNLIGLGLGPMITGALTDFVFSGPTDIKYSLAWINGAALPFAVIALWWGRSAYRRARAEEIEDAAL